MRAKVSQENLFEENEQLRAKLEETEETLRAIQHGEIDALVVKAKDGTRIYTLKGAEHTYRLLIESMNEGAVTFDSEGIILYSNESFAQLTGLPLQKVIGLHIQTLLPHDDRQSFIRLLNKSRNQKNSKREFQLLSVENTLTPVIFSVSPLPLDNDKRGYSMIITDLTEHKINEKIIANERLSAQQLEHEKKMNQQKDDFMAIVSHELKTPVTSLKVFGQMLHRRFVKNGDLTSAEHLSKMGAQINKLTSLIGDLLNVTRIDSGKLQFHQTTFDFNELLENTVEEIQRTTETHTIIKKLDRKKIFIKGDRDRIGQVIINFLTNAIKYSPHADKVVVKTVLDASCLQVSVQDFGMGISKDKHSKIFERFYRETGPEEITIPGLGLGLYISAEIIKRQGGKIWVKSKVGKGSTFFFSLPIAKKKK